MPSSPEGRISFRLTILAASGGFGDLELRSASYKAN